MTRRGATFLCALASTLAIGLAPHSGGAYPLDAYERTGIARLEGYRTQQTRLLERGTLQPGSLWPSAALQLRLAEQPDFELPTPDAALTRAVVRALGGEADRYGVALLDLSDPARPAYAEHRGDVLQNPGSVAKLLVALGWFQALADRFPEVADRERTLRRVAVTADRFIHTDSHTVPIFTVGDERIARRPIALGDRANLWTWFDWMLSASSNAAASTLIKQLLLFREFGTAYPPTGDEERRFFSDTPRARLQDALREALSAPVAANGLDLTRLRQGGFFTAEGKRQIPGGNSVSTPREWMRYLVRLEQGRLVDRWSSLELKRMLYMTERRIRYASHPVLNDAAVFFKSGSLYQCRPEEGFRCAKYHGNVINYMNSVAIVETPGEPTLRYLVVVLSNVLRRNSAVEHQTLALRVHRAVEARHGVAARSSPPPPDATTGAP